MMNIQVSLSATILATYRGIYSLYVYVHIAMDKYIHPLCK